MKTKVIVAILLSAAFSVKSQTLPPSSKVPIVHLFNGKDLNGWYQVYDGNGPEKNLFKAENGMIHVYPAQAENSTQSFGAIITETEYENYTLSLEYKWGEKKFKPRENSVRDAGVLIHVFGEDVIWPAGIECQIQEGDTGDLWIVKSRASTKVHPMNRNFDEDGLVSTLGSREQLYSRFPRSYYWEKPGWNKVVLEVKGDFARFYVNDKLVNEAIDMKKWDETQKKWIPLVKGKILLQAEGSEVFYRNVTLQPLVKE